MSNIKLSPKHGVNPCVPTCFWCGKDKNEVALLGRLLDDAKAPHNAVMDYEPCDDCKAGMAQGITLVEATDKPYRDHPPMRENPPAYPTGCWVVVTEDAMRRWLKPSEMLDDVLKQRRALLDPVTWDAIGLPREEG